MAGQSIAPTAGRGNSYARRSSAPKTTSVRRLTDSGHRVDRGTAAGLIVVRMLEDVQEFRKRPEPADAAGKRGLSSSPLKCRRTSDARVRPAPAAARTHRSQVDRRKDARGF